MMLKNGSKSKTIMLMEAKDNNLYHKPVGVSVFNDGRIYVGNLESDNIRLLNKHLFRVDLVTLVVPAVIVSIVNAVAILGSFVREDAPSAVAWTHDLSEAYFGQFSNMGFLSMVVIAALFIYKMLQTKGAFVPHTITGARESYDELSGYYTIVSKSGYIIMTDADRVPLNPSEVDYKKLISGEALYLLLNSFFVGRTMEKLSGMERLASETMMNNIESNGGEFDPESEFENEQLKYMVEELSKNSDLSYKEYMSTMDTLKKTVKK